jgi:hypothetical protein
MVLTHKLRLTLYKELRPMFNSNQAFVLVQKLKLAPKGFILGVKAEIEKNNSICPKLLINAEL